MTELLARTPHVLLDFDGPVCSVFSTITSTEATSVLARSLRQLGVALPAELDSSADPFALLYVVAEQAPEHSATAERTLTELEIEGVQQAAPTPHLRDMLDALTHTGHLLTVVSNNAADAVRTFLAAHDLAHYFDDLAARTNPDPALLKPAPDLLRIAAARHHSEPAQCVMLGDSANDVQAAKVFGAHSIAFANKPHKHHALRAAEPDALVRSLAEVTEALQAA